jgi:hypothetical protein
MLARKKWMRAITFFAQFLARTDCRTLKRSKQLFYGGSKVTPRADILIFMHGMPMHKTNV